MSFPSRPSPQRVQSGQSVVDLFDNGWWKDDGVLDQFQAGLQGPDARAELSDISVTSRTGREYGGESLQSHAEVPPLRVQREEAGGTRLAGREGVAVSTTAGVTAAPDDARSTQTGSGLLVTNLWEGSIEIAPARCGHDKIYNGCFTAAPRCHSQSQSENRYSLILKYKKKCCQIFLLLSVNKHKSEW